MASSTSNTSPVTKNSFGDKLISYLTQNPSENDVTFLVGPGKEEVKGLKVILKAACPAFDKLFKDKEKKWDTAGVSLAEDGRISLPNFNPGAFRIFIQLLVQDVWSSEEIEGMRLSLKTVFDVLDISKEFQMIELENIFQLLAEKRFKNFSALSRSQDLLELPRDRLESMLASEFLQVKEIEVFRAAYRWAERRCVERNLDKTGPNMRKLLGSAIFKIRFPLMTASDILQLVSTTDLLTETEQLQILKFIVSGKYPEEASSQPFNTQKRNGASVTVAMPDQTSLVSTIHFFDDLKIVSSPPCICNGSNQLVVLNVSKRIELLSVGFLGPVLHDDAEYVVKVDVHRYPDKNSLFDEERTIQAKSEQIFHVTFDQPVILEPFATLATNEFSKSHGFYVICFSLKGPVTQSPQILAKDSVFLRNEVDGVAVYSGHLRNPLAAITFRKL